MSPLLLLTRACVRWFVVDGTAWQMGNTPSQDLVKFFHAVGRDRAELLRLRSNSSRKPCRGDGDRGGAGQIETGDEEQHQLEQILHDLKLNFEAIPPHNQHKIAEQILKLIHLYVPPPPSLTDHLMEIVSSSREPPMMRTQTACGPQIHIWSCCGGGCSSAPSSSAGSQSRAPVSSSVPSKKRDGAGPDAAPSIAPA